MPKKLIVELPERNKTTHVQYSDAPLLLDGATQKICINDLYKKIGGKFVYSSDLCSTKKHPPYRNKNHIDIKSEDKFTKNFKIHGFAHDNSFVICNMGDLGHGVCASKDFEPYECFILYSGIITTGEDKSKTSYYKFKYNSQISLSVDAAERGNISRFIQHMPLNHQYFQESKQDMPDFHQELSSDNESDEFWQWKNLVCKSDLNESQIAWANLSCRVVWLKDKPCVVLFNTRKVSKGEQLGFSYGHGYWIGRGLKPELFDTLGNVIPSNKYGYKEAPIYLPTADCFKNFLGTKDTGLLVSYDKAKLLDDLRREHETVGPVWFHHTAEPVSIFKLRELLVKYNAIEADYGPIENDFVRDLREIVPDEFKVSIFKRPANDNSGREIQDMVFVTDDLIKWSQLTILLKGPAFKGMPISFKCFKMTQEVVFMDVGEPINQILISQIFKLGAEGAVFKKYLPKRLIPVGPERGSSTACVQPRTDEAIKQILRSNPEMTIETIKIFYNLMELPFEIRNPMKLISGEQFNRNRKGEVLDTATHKFFKSNPPARWKVYPKNRLKGKFIGHELMFFTFPKDEQSQQVTSFLKKIKEGGFHVELKKAKDRSSIVVDLTESKPTGALI